MLKPGTYEFADSMCSNTPIDPFWDISDPAALCIDHSVTIEAEVAGSVVLDAKGARRVIYVAAAGRAELIGLNITGGAAIYVRFLASSIEPMYVNVWISSSCLCRGVASASMAQQI